MEEVKLYKNKAGNNYSVYPPQTYFTFDYWVYMVPQYKPKDVLILGYGNGTIAGLIRLIWGDIPITGVDIEPCQNRYNVNFIQADAEEFVKNCREFDCVIVDLFKNDETEVCDFVSSPQFVANLQRISNYLIVNSLHADMSSYKHLRKIGINKPSGSAVEIYYFEIKDKIPNLHPWK